MNNENRNAAAAETASAAHLSPTFCIVRIEEDRPPYAHIEIDWEKFYRFRMALKREPAITKIGFYEDDSLPAEVA